MELHYSILIWNSLSDLILLIYQIEINEIKLLNLSTCNSIVICIMQ